MSRIDYNGADWYSYEEEYEDEDGQKMTRTKYVYEKRIISKQEAEEKNYTYLGRTYETEDTYFSLGGAAITYDKDNFWEMSGLQKIKDADLSITGVVDAMDMADDFWQNYDQLIGTGSSLGTMIGNFMDLSKGFRGTMNAISWGSVAFNFTQDTKLLINGALHGIALSDAAANVVSVMGWPGAAASVVYSTAKTGARGMMKLEQGLQNQANQLYKRYVGMYAGFGF